MPANKTVTPNTAEVIIIGGGVIGLTIARELAQRGVREVTLIERGQPGAEASWAAGGILAPQVEADRHGDFFQLACTSRDLFPELAASLKEETGVDVELDTSGTLYLGFTSKHEAELRNRYEWQRGEGLNVEWLTSAEALQLEPGISDKVRCALRFPRDFQIDNRRLVSALLRANEELGVRLMTGLSVHALRIEHGKVRGVETSSGILSAPVIVIAAGAWSTLINSAVAAPFQIEPVRGQMLCFEARPQIARHVIYSSLGYLVPRRDARVLAGSTEEHVGFDKRVTIEGSDAIRSMAREIAPGIAALPMIDSWAGFRPRAKDGLPVLGSSAAVAGLFYATGHYRNGILLAPITGKVIAEMVVDAIMPAGIEAFSPDRFSSI